MKKGFYLRLALDGMRKNRRLYLPYLLTGAGMVMMFYILYSLACSPLMGSIRGGSSMAAILMLGTIVMAVFALLFLIYTNSFLIRRRNKEFGLYNILGMNKQNISRILLWETLLSALIAIVAGLLGGLLFAKLAELFLLHMAGEEAGYAIRIEPKGVALTFGFFSLIFALLLAVSLARVGLSKPLDLLKSEATGEKPPKANWLLAAVGVAVLGGAYWLAVSIEAPLTALVLFFIAVVMVILATYLLFIAGSVTLCKLLQKNKGYYYKAAHFVSVSSMAFRMKRNGAGLASICILATMVLVMLSSTSCLYFGGERAMRDQYPYDLTFEVKYLDSADCTPDSLEKLVKAIRPAAQGQEQNLLAYSMMEISGGFEDGRLDVSGYSRFLDVMSASASMLEQVRTVCFLPLDDYNHMAGTDLSLSPGEALIWSSGKPYSGDTLTVEGCRPLRVRGTLEELPFRFSSNDLFVTVYCVVLPDWADYVSGVEAYVESLDNPMIAAFVEQKFSFDLPGVSAEEQLRIEDAIFNAVYEANGEDRQEIWSGFGVSSYADGRGEFFSMYGSLFFLGIILSIVFIAAAALIIYYKQLSEGYEDQSRFGIMQKVGMTSREIKSAVNSQVLTVFFAPLLLAGVHLAFAFPFMQKIIRLFGVMNTPLLIGTSAVCFLAFALFYVFVYRATARTYYAIVSSEAERQAA